MFEDLHLAKLPSDVIRKIIGAGMGFVYEMKLISPRWNTLANELLQDKSKLPAIESCSWIFRGRKTSICINTHPDFKNYLGINTWPYSPSKSSHECEFQVVSSQLEEENEKYAKYFTRIFGRCSSIKNLHFLAGNNDPHRVFAIQKVMGNLTVDQLFFKGNRFIGANILSIFAFIKCNKVRLLSLCIFALDLFRNCEVIVQDALSDVQTVEFVQLVHVTFTMNLDEIRSIWQKETDWLNQRDGITAVLKEGEVDNDYVEMCISMRRRPSN